MRILLIMLYSAVSTMRNIVKIILWFNHTAQDRGDTKNGTGTIENNGYWSLSGPVWTVLHNIVELIHPGPIPG